MTHQPDSLNPRDLMDLPGALLIQNDGDAIASTNYWQSDFAENGLFFLTWFGHVARLLVPDQHIAAIPTMTGAQHVVMSRGPYGPTMHDSTELMFEDDSDAPFALFLPKELTDHPIAQTMSGLTLTIWRPEGLIATLPCMTRMVARLPHAQPWQDPPKARTSHRRR